MARTETSRLRITLEIDQATRKLLEVKTAIGGVEQSFNKAGQAAQRFGATAKQSGQQTAAAAVGFQTYAQGALNVSTSVAMTYTSFTNLASAEHRVSLAMVGLARAEDLLNNKRTRANEMVKAGTAVGEKYKNILNEIRTAEADWTAKSEKLRIEKSKMNDVFILFGMNLANVAVSLGTTIAAMKAARAAAALQRAEQLKLNGELMRTNLTLGMLGPNLHKARIAFIGASFSVKGLGWAFKSLYFAMGPVGIAMVGITTALGLLLPHLEEGSRGFFGMSDSLEKVESKLGETTDATAGLDNSLKKLNGTMVKDMSAGTRVMIDGLNNQIQHADNYIDRLEKIKLYYQILRNAGIVGKDFSIGGSAPVSIGTGVGVGYTSGGGIIPTGTGGTIQTGVGVSTSSGGGSPSVANGVPTSAVPESQPTATMNTSHGRGNHNLIQNIKDETKLKNIFEPTHEELMATRVYTDKKKGIISEHLTAQNEKELYARYDKMEQEYIAQSLPTLTDKRLGDRGHGSPVPPPPSDYESAMMWLEEEKRKYNILPEDRMAALGRTGLKGHKAPEPHEIEGMPNHVKFLLGISDPPFDSVSPLGISMMASGIDLEGLNSHERNLFWSIVDGTATGDETGYDAMLKYAEQQILHGKLTEEKEDTYSSSKFIKDLIDEDVTYDWGLGGPPKISDDEVKKLNRKKYGYSSGSGLKYDPNPDPLYTDPNYWGGYNLSGLSEEDKEKFKMVMFGKLSSHHLQGGSQFDFGTNIGKNLKDSYGHMTMGGIDRQAFLTALSGGTSKPSGYFDDYGIWQSGKSEGTTTQDEIAEALGLKTTKQQIEEADARRRLYGDQGFDTLNFSYLDRDGDRLIDKNFGQEALSQFAKKELTHGRTELSRGTTLVTDDKGNQTLEFNQNAIGDSFNRRNAIAMGRMAWYKEQNKHYTISRGGSGTGIVNHYVKNAVTQEDREAMSSLAESHDQQVREFAQQAYDSGKNLDILWLRKQTENQAKALSASIGARVSAERATASQFGSQLGIPQTEALQILRDKSQGEQTLIDMLSYQMRLGAISNGVVS